MLGYLARHQPPPEPFCLVQHGDASDASKHAAEAHCQEDRGINVET